MKKSTRPILFYSDLHIRPETEETCDHVLTEIGNLAEKHGALIVNGGDTHNTRGLIKTSSLDMLTRHFMNWRDRGLQQIMLVGNHDQEDRAGAIHPLRAFDGWTSGGSTPWRVIDKPEVIEGVAYFPFLTRDRVLDAISAVPKTVKVAVVHWGIQGAKRNDWNVDTDGIPVEWLAQFEQVFSGHYHYRNSFENIQYIGSPYQQNFSEANQPKGVLLYGKGKISFIEIEGTPKHFTVTCKVENGSIEIGCETCEIGSIGEKDSVKVEVEGDAEEVARIGEAQIRKHLSAGVIKFDRHGRVKSHSRLGIKASEALDPLTVMQKYVAFVDTGLERKRLLKIGEEFLK